DAGARRLLLEDHRQHLVLQQFGALTALGAGLELIGDGEHAAQLVFGEILKRQEMAGRAHAVTCSLFCSASIAASAAEILLTASSMSASVMIRGGRKRSTLSPAP